MELQITQTWHPKIAADDRRMDGRTDGVDPFLDLFLLKRRR